MKIGRTQSINSDAMVNRAKRIPTASAPWSNEKFANVGASPNPTLAIRTKTTPNARDRVGTV